MRSKRFKLGLAAAAIAVGGLATASLAGASSSATSAAAKVVGSGQASATKSVCGLGNGKKATGSPILLGAIATKQAGTDFSDIPNMAAAYFACVNANGGINGHPIKYDIEFEQTNPTQVASLAKKLIQTEHVLGIVGNTSIIDCAVNHKYYESEGFYIIDSGIAAECYSTSHSAPVNMGPRYSSDGAAQYLLSKGVKKLVFDQSNVPGTGYNVGGVALIAKHAGVPLTELTENVPIQDANSVAEKEVQEAGNGGGVVLNFTPPEALKILQAAQQQGLENKVQWACSTPCNTDFLASALGASWNGKLAVNAELNLPSSSGPDETLYRQVLKQYGKAVAGGLGSFSQMGFVEARVAVAALLGISGPYTVQSVNQAFVATKDFKTDILCKPWYYGQAPYHVPNNYDRTVTPENGHMVQEQGCFAISPVDPEIAKIRAIEKTQHLNG